MTYNVPIVKTKDNLKTTIAQSDIIINKMSTEVVEIISDHRVLHQDK